MANFFFHTDLLFEKINIAHMDVFVAIKGPWCQWILLAKFWDDGLVDLHPDFSFNLEANWLDNFVSESSVYLFFIVVHTNIWLLKMPDVPEHLDRVVHGHEEVVDLIWSLDITHDHVEDEWKQAPNPIYETAPSWFLDNLLPIWDDLEPLAKT